VIALTVGSWLRNGLLALFEGVLWAKFCRASSKRRAASVKFAVGSVGAEDMIKLFNAISFRADQSLICWKQKDLIAKMADSVFDVKTMLTERKGVYFVQGQTYELMRASSVLLLHVVKYSRRRIDLVYKMTIKV